MEETSYIWQATKSFIYSTFRLLVCSCMSCDSSASQETWVKSFIFLFHPSYQTSVNRYVRYFYMTLHYEELDNTKQLNNYRAQIRVGEA